MPSPRLPAPFASPSSRSSLACRWRCSASGCSSTSAHLTGSFAAAGIVAGAFAVSLGVGGPLLGRLVDRRGQTTVLLAGRAGRGRRASRRPRCCRPARRSSRSSRWPPSLGLSTPPVGACLRAILPAVVARPRGAARRLRRRVGRDRADLDLRPARSSCWSRVAWSTGAALVLAGAVLVAGTAVFAAQPASRAWRPAAAPERARGGSLRAPAMRTLVLVLLARRRGLRRRRGRRRRGRRRARQRGRRRPAARHLGRGLAGGRRHRRAHGRRRAHRRRPRARARRRSPRATSPSPRPPAAPWRWGRCSRRRGDHRADLRERLRHGRPRGAGRDRDRGVRLAEHRRRRSAPRPARRAPEPSPTPPARRRPSCSPAPPAPPPPSSRRCARGP